MKSWRTSHLPNLQVCETQGILDLMHGWFQDSDFSFSNRCNWPVLWEYIDRNGLGGVLGSSVLDGLCDIPEQFSQMAEHRYFSSQLHYEQALRCCKALTAAAIKLEIPLRILKGPALVHQGYVDTGTRYFSDIDVFTDSWANILKLSEELGGIENKSSEQQGLVARLGESDCYSFYLDNWELEFRYPLDPPGEPMFELLSFYQDSLLTVPGSVEDLLEPDPSLHLVFLIQHMAVHHLFSRFFWFLDLAVLVRNRQESIDFKLVGDELQRLGLSNVAGVASSFCQEHIAPDFPLLRTTLPAWNVKMMKCFAAPDNIANGRFGIYHEKLRDKIYAYLVGMVSFYLVADPGKKRGFGFATNWTLNRFRNSFGVKKPIRLVDFLLRPVLAMVLMPVAWTLSLLTDKEKGS